MSDESRELQQCPHCGQLNRVGMVFCENCGTNLHTGEGPEPKTRLFVEEDEDSGVPTVPEADEAVQAIREKKGTGHKSARGTGAFTSQTRLKLELESWPTPLELQPEPDREIVLGRRDPGATTKLSVDLAPYGAYPLGVSRRHAVIRLLDNRLEIEDLESSNGTYLNETALQPGHPLQLHDGDELRLARLTMYVRFEV